MSRRSRFSWRSTLRPALSAAGLLLVAVLLVGQDWNEIRRLLTGIGPQRIGLALLAILLSRLAVAGRWHVLLRGADPSVRFRDSIQITFAGLFASNFLPTTIGGDLVRLAGAFQLNVDRAVSAASLVVDRLVGMAGMGLAAPLGLAGAASALRSGAWQGGMFSSAGIAVMSTATVRPTSSLLARVRRALSRVWSAFGIWLHQPATLALSFALTLGHMTCLFGSILVLLTAMGEPRGFLEVAGGWSLVYFITLFPISVNGLGVQELALTLVFTGSLGLPADVTLVLAVGLRLLLMTASLPGALFLGRLLPGARALAARRAADAGG